MIRPYPVGEVVHDEDFSRLERQNIDVSAVTFLRCNFSYSTISDSILDGATFSHCPMDSVTIEHTSADDVGFESSDLQRARLRDVDVNGCRFRGGSLRNADLWLARFRNGEFRQTEMGWLTASGGSFDSVQFFDTELDGARFLSVGFRGASFENVQLPHSVWSDIKLEDSRWRNVDLRHASFFRVNCDGASFENCNVFGLGVCELAGQLRRESRLLCGEGPDPLLLNDLRFAPFLHELAYEDAFGRVVEALTAKFVLILGRFTDDRKPILDRLRRALRHFGYVPHLVDYDCKQSWLHVVKTAAMCSRFVIADLTEPRSVPAEVVEILRLRETLIVAPIVQAGYDEPPIFGELRATGQLLTKYEYRDADVLIRHLATAVIEPCETTIERMERAK